MFEHNEPGLHLLYSRDGLVDVEAWLRQPRPVYRYVSEEPRFRGCSIEQAHAYAATGWSEGAARLQRQLDELPSPRTAHAKLTRDVAGYYPDVPRFLSGAPDCMLRRGNPNANRPVMRIVINGAALASVDAADMSRFGLACASAVEQIEASGKRVELDIMFACSQEPSRATKHYAQGWKVKLASEPLDTAALAFSLGHPAALRVLAFELRGRCEGIPSSFGWSIDLTPRMLQLIGAAEDNVIVVNGIGRRDGVCSTQALALEYVRGQLLAEIDA